MFGFLKKNAKIPFIFRNFAAYSSDPINSRNALIKPYTIEQNSLVFSVYPLKAVFRENSDYISVCQEGAIIFEFIEKKPKEKNSNLVELDWENKRFFPLGMENVGHLLAVTDYELEFGSIGITLKNQEKELMLKKPKEKSEFSISLKEVNKEKDCRFNISVAEFLVIRELCKFAVPYLVGFQRVSVDE